MRVSSFYHVNITANVDYNNNVDTSDKNRMKMQMTIAIFTVILKIMKSITNLKRKINTCSLLTKIIPRYSLQQSHSTRTY